MMTDIVIQKGMAAHHIERAADLYYAAFYQKLQPIFRDEERGKTVLRKSINANYVIVALANDQVVGLAGFKEAGGQLLDITPKIMRDTFGFIGGWARLLVLALFERKLEPDTLLMDGIVVDADMRGQGIGSKLLDAIVDYACTHQYAQVRLDVVDTNPRARQLYERKGFIAQKTEYYGWLKPIFGFSGSTTMLKPTTDSG